jgi:hypothetical protein
LNPIVCGSAGVALAEIVRIDRGAVDAIVAAGGLRSAVLALASNAANVVAAISLSAAIANIVFGSRSRARAAREAEEAGALAALEAAMDFHSVENETAVEAARTALLVLRVARGPASEGASGGASGDASRALRALGGREGESEGSEGDPLVSLVLGTLREGVALSNACAMRVAAVLLATLAARGPRLRAAIVARGGEASLRAALRAAASDRDVGADVLTALKALRGLG